MKGHFIFLFSFLTVTLLAQPGVGPYSWQDHLSFNSANTVAKLGGDIYASNYNGLLKIDFNEHSSQRKNKINGLSDVGIRLLRTNTYNNKMLVIYDNCNIDIIDTKGNVINYPDIKLKTIGGKKIINEVFFKNQFAYLACGFGIVLFDTEKMEVKDTYIIGPNGSNLEVNQIALNDSLIFASTAQGLYRANYVNSILNNFNNWTKAPNLPVGPYSGVIAVQNQILAAYAPSFTTSTTANLDTLYALNNNAWSIFSSAPHTIRKLGYTFKNMFTIFDQYGALVYNLTTGAQVQPYTSFNGLYPYHKDLVFDYDKTDALSFWYADYYNGIYQTYGLHPYFRQNLIAVNGTNKYFVSQIDIYDGKVAVAPSYPNSDGSSLYLREGVNILKDNEWKAYVDKDPTNGGGDIIDINYVYFDRKDKSRMYASAWFNGLLEYKNNQLVAVYNASNTSMGEAYPTSARVSGLGMDSDGNLWFANSDAKKMLSVRKRDGSFVTFNFDAGRFVRKILVDKNNHIWLLHERDQGITVFKNINFSQPVLNVNYKLLTKDVGNGNLESNSVFSIAEDKDGKIWVGTTAGIRVFYNPSSIFSSSNFDAEPIKIVQDGNVELLLEKEIVTAICIDGANNKWVGTQNGGLYCFSPDGLKELFHFTVDNSPLYSNDIVDVNYDKITGDIFIGTLAGLQSFRTPIIEGDDNYNNVYAYPNPVKPGFNGHVFVRGLVDNSVVKITDESGNLVWETKSQGGQIEWPVKTLSGNRVATGVYIVYAQTTTAELKALTKVLVVN